MPPSPALRYSPMGESRMENHKRGRSLEGGLIFKEKDDDLALFNEMQSKERENFLVHSSDDFEDTFAMKLRHFSDIKLGISIPVRGESSELLNNADGDKNDYDWLLTPPDTPLFPSLDDEPPPTHVASRGRPRSQPITISRSSTMEKSYQSSRGSPSPNRLSSSPRSSSTTLQSRGRPSSAPHSGPTLSQRAATPSRRPSSPNTAATSAPRSLTPTSRRMSAGSVARGTSPVRTNRGNSISPKIRAWQPNIPGFSSEAPPNLRTSLADRPASYIRGSSPASRNGRDSSAKFVRQSMSPTASRSVSSSHSKGSVASSGDDDVDSMQSTHVGNLDCLTKQKMGTFPSNRGPVFSKRSTRMFSPSSAPKRSFDSALRQMDHRKSAQNMFRPLLSSVPSSTFYAGKSSSAHHFLKSRHSSVTTSSNTSSDQGINAALDTEGSDHHEYMAIGSGKLLYADVEEEVFAFDKMDTSKKDVGHDMHHNSMHFKLGEFDRDLAADSEEFGNRDIDVEISSARDNHSSGADFSEVDSLETREVCSKCSRRYRAIEIVGKDINLCPDCNRQDNLVADTNLESTVVDAENTAVVSMEKISEEYKAFDEPVPPMIVPDVQLQVIDMVEAGVSEFEDNVNHGQMLYHEQHHIHSKGSSLPTSVVELGKEKIDSPKGMGEMIVGCLVPDNEAGGQQVLHTSEYQTSKIDFSEGSGISVLLKRSGSSKGPIFQGRALVTSSITYEELSYAKDSNSLRSSIGHCSTSASSLADFSSVRQVETRIQRQLSGKKLEMENYKYDKTTRPQSGGSSFSETPKHAHLALGLATSAHEENTEWFDVNIKHDGVEETAVAFGSEVVASEEQEMVDSSTSCSVKAVPEEDTCRHNEYIRTVEPQTLDISSHMAGSPLEESIPYYENEEDCSNNARSVSDVEASASHVGPSVEVEHTMLNTNADGQDIAEVVTHRRLPSITETDNENHCQSSPGSEDDNVSTNSNSAVSDLQDLSVPTSTDNNVAASVPQHDSLDHALDILEDSAVMMESQGGSKARSLTLKEATDTILFCSSIVHDLAYQAATIAIEKENSAHLEVSRPTITVPEKSIANRIDPCGRTTGKRASKPQKVKQRRAETDAKALSVKTENDENANEPNMRPVGLPNKMDSAKPPKLESRCNCTIM